jgi:ankyrin repeat protein
MNNIDFNNLFPTQESLVKYIDDKKALDITDYESNTLLIYICNHILNSNDMNSWIHLAMKMLEFPPSQINLKHANNEGNTALILVSGVDNVVVKKMLSFGPEEVNLNAVEHTLLMNALMYCLTKDSEEIALEMLHLPTIDISVQNINKDGYTPLMLACEEKLEEVALTMIDLFPTDILNVFQKNNKNQNAFDIALNNNLVNVYRLLNYTNYVRSNEEDSESQDSNIEKEEEKQWANKEMPVIPTYPEQFINNSENGYDPFLLEEKNIKEYLDEDNDNIVILYEGKNYLLSRSIIQKQWEEAIVFECLNAEGIKNPTNIVKNLPLFNIKSIGIDIPTDKIGIWPEFIYEDGMDNIFLPNEDQYFSIIPLVDKMLISVISLNEVKKIGTALGSAYGSLHCQNGQGGMAGIIVAAKSTNSGGNSRKPLKKKITLKRGKNMKRGKSMKKKRKSKKRRITRKRGKTQKKRN